MEEKTQDSAETIVKEQIAHLRAINKQLTDRVRQGSTRDQLDAYAREVRENARAIADLLNGR